nr:hypothetical protein [Tanacetum cinerariifolium]
YSEVDFNQFADPSADDTTLGLTESTTELDPSEPARPEEPATSTRHDTHDDADTGLVGTRLDIDVSFNRAPDPSADDTTQPSAKPPARR